MPWLLFSVGFMGEYYGPELTFKNINKYSDANQLLLYIVHIYIYIYINPCDHGIFL